MTRNYDFKKNTCRYILKTIQLVTFKDIWVFTNILVESPKKPK